MKKVIVCFITIVLVFCSTAVAFAIEIPEGSASISECESIQYYAAMTESEMDSLGYSKEEISDIMDYKKSYAENIISYSQMAEEELIEMDFSPNQIKAFQDIHSQNPVLNNNATEKEINCFLQEYATTAAAATLTMSVAKYSKNGKYNKFKASWNWKGRPVIVGFKDNIGLVWTNGHTVESYSDIKVTLKCDSSTNPSYTVPKAYKDICVPDQSFRVKFPCASSGGWLYKSGVCYFTLYNDDNKDTTTISWKYAHGTVQVSSFGLSLKGGSFSVVTGYKEMYKNNKKFSGLK